MILADTSIWIDYLRGNQPLLETLLDDGRIVMHPLVAGEIAVGSLKERARVLARIDRLPKATRARDYSVMQLIEGHRLFSRGLSFIDTHLLASARLMPETSLWSRDHRLAETADRLGVGFDPTA